MKKILNLLFIIPIFSSFVFAQDTVLSVNKNQFDINDPIHLTLNISGNNKQSISINEIKWLDKFEVVGKSQSQSFQSINWVVSSNISLNIQLIAKEKWHFILGPAIINDGNQTITTNSVEIDVNWTRIFMNNNLNRNPKVIPSNPLNSTTLWQKEENIDEEDTKQEKKDDIVDSNLETNNWNNSIINNKKLFLYITSILLLIGSFFVFIGLKSDTKEKSIKNSQEWKNKNNIDFEKKEINFDLPKINDKQFANKLDNILRNKLSSFCKWQKSIYGKTYDEILASIQLEQKNELEKIFTLLNKIKYSNNIIDKNKLLDISKKLLENI